MRLVRWGIKIGFRLGLCDFWFGIVTLCDNRHSIFKSRIRSVAESNLDSSRPNLFLTTNNFRRKQIIQHNIQIEENLFGGLYPLNSNYPLIFCITAETANIKDRPIHARNQFTLGAWLKIFTVPALFTDTNIRQRINGNWLPWANTSSMILTVSALRCSSAVSEKCANINVMIW